MPEADLLKALHTYASDFYEKTTGLQAGSSYESMDETALIALGILLEEMCKEKLGHTGDLAFVEGEEDNYASERKETMASGEKEVEPAQDKGRHDQDEFVEDSQRRKRRRIRRKF